MIPLTWHRRHTRGVRGAMPPWTPNFLALKLGMVMYCTVLLSCNFWTKDTWFALAELVFSCCLYIVLTDLALEQCIHTF